MSDVCSALRESRVSRPPLASFSQDARGCTTRPSQDTMSSPPNNRRFSGHSLSASRSITHSVYAPTASSRPFLNMLNPLGHAQGYMAANQSVLEEDEEDTDAASPRHERIDLEAQVFPTSTSKASFAAPGTTQLLTRGPTETSILRPNVREDDRTQEESESDGEVPQSFLIESPASHRAPLSRKGRARDTRHATNATIDAPRISVPPRPSEINVDRPTLARPPPAAGQSNPKRGLDAYERALWNWVNVYNLDAFLQEVYLYYHNKGIYSIALKRGLNLLSVPPRVSESSLMPSPAQSVLSLPFRHSSSVAWTIRASTLIKSHGYPILLSTAASPGALPPSLNTHLAFLRLYNLQFLGFYVPLLPAVLCFLRLANRFVCIKHNASRGHVSLLYISPSNTRRASLTYMSRVQLSTFFPGRYPDYLLARSRPTHWSHP
jgi:hypothetical protein